MLLIPRRFFFIKLISNFSTQFYLNFGEYVEKMSPLAATNNSCLCMAGDFNTDLLDIKNEAHASDFVDVLYSHNLFPTIHKPARITNTSASVLGSVFLNNRFFQFSGLLYADISDHLPIFTAFDCSPVQSSTSNIS